MRTSVKFPELLRILLHSFREKRIWYAICFVLVAEEHVLGDSVHLATKRRSDNLRRIRGVAIRAVPYVTPVDMCLSEELFDVLGGMFYLLTALF